MSALRSYSLTFQVLGLPLGRDKRGVSVVWSVRAGRFPYLWTLPPGPNQILPKDRGMTNVCVGGGEAPPTHTLQIALCLLGGSGSGLGEVSRGREIDPHGRTTPRTRHVYPCLKHS